MFTVSMDMDRASHQVSRLEVVNTGRRRRWSIAEKIRIVEESLSGRGLGSATARRYGIASSLLFKWRRAYREGSLAPDGDCSLVPAMVVPDQRVDAGSGVDFGRMEIVLPGGARVIVGADVDRAALARVLEVLVLR